MREYDNGMENKDHLRDIRTGTGLIDPELPPEVAHAAAAVASSLIDAVGRRAVAVFLGTDKYEKLNHMSAELMSTMMLECLPAFVHEQKGQIAFGMRFGNRGEIVNLTQSAVIVNGQTRPYLQDGYLFINLPNERVVVSAERASGMRDDFFVIEVRSNKDSACFWRRWQEYSRKHNYLRGQAFFADGKIIERQKTYGWDSIILPEDVRKTIHNHVELFLQNGSRLRKLGVKLRRGLILSGPPGTGKTLLGKVLANTLGVSFMWVSPRHVKGPESFEQILTVARFVAPTVIFLEDLDLFAEERDGNKWLGLGELMNQLDGAVDNDDIITIATTNRLEVIEKALRNRPGRFDRVVEIGPLDEPCRQQLLRRLLASAQIAPSDFSHLLLASEGYTGAQVEEMVNTLYMLAVGGDNTALTQANPSDKPVISISRGVIDAGLDEFRVERITKLGFHAA